jgi:hypothetical protein
MTHLYFNKEEIKKKEWIKKNTSRNATINLHIIIEKKISRYFQHHHIKQQDWYYIMDFLKRTFHLILLKKIQLYYCGE